MKLLYNVKPMIHRRLFTSAVMLRKDEKSKQHLKDLGLSLQKGNIKSNEQADGNESSNSPRNQDPNQQTKQLSSQELSEREENLNRLKEFYESTSHMTVNDLMIQKNLDEGKQFSFPSEHYLDRKKLIRESPDEIDIFKTPAEVIDKTYEDLSKLDNDKSVHLKYYKKYLKKYDDPINRLIQEFNGISEKFKLLRRREIDSLSLSPGAYLYKENLFNHPYNVVGFDRSISGLPLRSGKHKLTDKCYPQEFVEDLQMFRTKLPVQKRDLDFIEFEKNSVNIDPNKISKNNITNKSKEMNRFLSSIYEELEVPKNSIFVDSIDDYKLLNFKNDLAVRIESEILILKKALQQEIEVLMKSNNGSRILMFNNQDLKTNQFRLCETKKPVNLNSSLFIINYNLKFFNLIPNYSVILSSISQKRKLERHLFKIFLINLEDQIDTLFRIKYYDERKMKKFMKNFTRNIHHVIKFKLIKYFKPFNDEDYKLYDALIYKPYSKTSFKRIYWLNNSLRKSNDINKKSNLIVNWADFEDLSER